MNNKLSGLRPLKKSSTAATYLTQFTSAHKTTLPSRLKLNAPPPSIVSVVAVELSSLFPSSTYRRYDGVC
ncbi:hypothetical protein TNCV_4315491 [Trichonephila clavipes]|nr:hypothetical protein TNCV_4315491 [Trichonephila clavipes]